MFRLIFIIRKNPKGDGSNDNLNDPINHYIKFSAVFIFMYPKLDSNLGIG
jgi:hypothetical protein